MRHQVHRRTVRQALASAVPPPRKEYSSRGRSAIDPFREVIDAWLVADVAAPVKQRHTARRTVPVFGVAISPRGGGMRGHRAADHDLLPLIGQRANTPAETPPGA